MCEFSPKPSHSALFIPDYDIEMNEYWYDYWSCNKSDYGFTSFVEGEIIGMDTFHKLNIPLIHLKTRSEKEDQEEKESGCKYKNKSNTESSSRSIINSRSFIPPNIISDQHETNPSTSNIIHYYFLL